MIDIKVSRMEEAYQNMHFKNKHPNKMYMTSDVFKALRSKHPELYYYPPKFNDAKIVIAGVEKTGPTGWKFEY